jgi:hypothetical protein
MQRFQETANLLSSGGACRPLKLATFLFPRLFKDFLY